MTTQIKGYPFEVLVSDKLSQSAVLAEQVKSLDWAARKAIYKGKISKEMLSEVKAKIAVLIGINNLN